MAIGPGNTFTTVPGRVILLREDFFLLYAIYIGAAELSFFFRAPTGPFVPLIRSKRLGRPSIFRAGRTDPASIHTMRHGDSSVPFRAGGRIVPGH